MIKLTKQQEVGLWEAWIEFDHAATQYFGTLYVVGEIESGRVRRPLIVSHERRQSGELVLRIDVTSSRGADLQEVLYSEPLASIDQYSSVAIYRGNVLIERIQDIEVMV